MRRSLLTFLCLLLCGPLALAVKEAPEGQEDQEAEETPKGPPGIPEEMMEKIGAALDARVESELDVAEICKKLKITNPPTPVKKDVLDIETDVEADVELAVARKFADDFTEKFEAEARKKHPLRKVGDNVTLRFKRGGAQQGRFYKNELTRVKVGYRYFSKVDLADETIIELDPEANEKAVRKYVRVQKSKLNVRKDDIRDQVRKELEDKFYRENGYVRWKRAWIPQQELFEKAKAWYAGRLKNKLKGEVAKTVLLASGYILHEGKWHSLEERARAIQADQEEDDKDEEEDEDDKKDEGDEDEDDKKDEGDEDEDEDEKPKRAAKKGWDEEEKEDGKKEDKEKDEEEDEEEEEDDEDDEKEKKPRKTRKKPKPEVVRIATAAKTEDSAEVGKVPSDLFGEDVEGEAEKDEEEKPRKRKRRSKKTRSRKEKAVDVADKEEDADEEDGKKEDKDEEEEKDDEETVESDSDDEQKPAAKSDPPEVASYIQDLDLDKALVDLAWAQQLKQDDDDYDDEATGAVRAFGFAFMLVFYAISYFVSVGVTAFSLWIGGKLTKVDASILCCLLTAAASRFVKMIIPGFLISSVASLIVSYTPSP